MVVFYRFILIYIFDKLEVEIRVGVEVDAQKIVDIRVRIILLLIETFEISSASSYLLIVDKKLL